MKKIFLILLVVTSHLATAQTDAARKQNFNVTKNAAIDGYDPVSYFDGKPQEGETKYNLAFKGIDYRFCNATNLAKFKTNPDKYEPAYGGWCAYAMGNSGEKVKVDPETYKILDGKLYLFYNSWGNNTLKSWNKDESKLKSKGDQNWKKFVP